MEDNNYAVTLPCKQEDFIIFISGLLGKPQTIERGYEGVFELTKEDVLNMYYLIAQRMKQQSHSSLVQCTIKIGYSDKSSVLLNSLEDFKTYAEIKPLISTSVDISLIYLVEFPQKRTPEKQQIDIWFRACNSPDNRHHFFDRSEVFLKINHTERTWGVDIESLITGHLNTLFKEENKIIKFISNKGSEIGFIVGILFFLTALITAYFETTSFINTNIETIKSLDLNTSNAVGKTLMELKIDVIADVIVTGKWNIFIYQVFGFLIVSLIISIFIGIFVSNKATYNPKSFVLLTKETLTLRDKYYDKKITVYKNIINVVVVPIIIGLITNFIFAKFSLN